MGSTSETKIKIKITTLSSFIIEILITKDICFTCRFNLRAFLFYISKIYYIKESPKILVYLKLFNMFIIYIKFYIPQYIVSKNYIKFSFILIRLYYTKEDNESHFLHLM